METNYVTDFTCKYIALMNKTKIGDYAACGSEYHLLLDSYDELMTCIDRSFDMGMVKAAKQKMEEQIATIQKKIKKAWGKIYQNEEYPEQSTIHGINIIIEKVLAEAEKL